MCNTVEETCQQKAAMMQFETNFFFFINEYFLRFSSMVLMHICVVSSNYRTLLGRNPVYSGNQGCITGFGKQQMREEILVIQISPEEWMQFW